MKFIHTLSTAILTVSLLFTLPAQSSESKVPAPDFTLKSMNGKNLKLSELRGEIVMLNFWASWCGPCRQEMPALESIYQKYQPMGFTLLGVNVEEDSDAAKDYLKDVSVNFPVLFDNTSKVSKLFDVVAMPSTILVDRDGNMRYLHQGYQPGAEDEYQQQIKALLKE